MSEIFSSLQTLMIDHVRLTLMTQIQQNKTINISQLILLAILVGGVSWLYETATGTGEGQKGFRHISFDWRSYVMRKHSILIEGKHVTGIDHYSRRPLTITNTFSKNFRAILFNILERIDTMKDVSELKEFATNVIKGDETNADDVKTIFTVSQRLPFILDADREIYCIVKEQGEQREEGVSSKQETRIIKFNIHLYSYKSRVPVIKEYVKTINAEYKRYLEEKRRGKLFVYTLNNTEVNNGDDDDTVGGWRETPHETMKSFDNIFFEGKRGVINKIKFFTENKEWYRRNGVPYTLGIALYGVPGTGKTSFIKALATHLNRHIISIPLSLIKTKKQLYDFYYETQYSNANDKHAIGFDKKIIVFEDIDCVGDIVLKRKSSKQESRGRDSGLVRDIDSIDDETDVDEFVNTTASKKTPEDTIKREIEKATKYVLKKMNGEEGGKMGPFMNSQDNIMLDDILNLWDGIRENTGRIMIITTNHYDKLDPALIRPGRIDMALNLENASRETIAEMHLHYYGVAIDPNDLVLVPDRFYSPAEVINFYVSNHENPRGFIERLILGNKI